MNLNLLKPSITVAIRHLVCIQLLAALSQTYFQFQERHDHLPLKEGITQGNPLAMVAYGILLLPLICCLKGEILDVHQPWYADDAGAGGTFSGIQQYFEWLQELGASRGYFPPEPKVKVFTLHNKAKAEAMFNDLKFHIITGSCYLDGFIGEASAQQQSWIKEKTKIWAESITKLAMIAK
jgi:hypothetical protein